MKYGLLLSIIFISFNIEAQEVVWQQMTPLPESITNNAVTEALVDDVPYMYTFAGMDSTKACGNAHLRSYRYNTQEDLWESIPDLPDPSGGVVAAGASTIGNMIYIVGGYHIRPNCSEVSSKAVHRYDPNENTYTRVADIPIAIDDHVQAVYNDSLLYVITGWSNSTNVLQVQIYDPSSDTWEFGTSVINDPDWRVFGASGSIIGNTIYYSGGASLTCDNTSCFGPTSILRKGTIDPGDPLTITWEEIETDAAVGYRMAASTSGDNFIWLGGSDITYNFDGIDYNGTGGVSPSSQFSSIFLNEGELIKTYDSAPSVMDLRGIAKVNHNTFYICGGMESDQKVTNKTYRIDINGLTSNEHVVNPVLQLYPNPTSDFISIANEYMGLEYRISNTSGLVVKKGKYTNQPIDIRILTQGQYNFTIMNNETPLETVKFIKQ